MHTSKTGCTILTKMVEVDVENCEVKCWRYILALNIVYITCASTGCQGN